MGIREDGSIPSNVIEEVDVAFNHVKQALEAAGLGDDAWEYVYKVRLEPPFYTLEYQSWLMK